MAPRRGIKIGVAEDVTDKIAVVTGANTGIGFHTAKILAKGNAKVILACRSKERGEKAVEELEKARRDGDDDADDDDDDDASSSRGRRCEFMALDLSDAIHRRVRERFKEIQTLGYFSQQRRIEHVGRV